MNPRSTFKFHSIPRTEKLLYYLVKSVQSSVQHNMTALFFLTILLSGIAAGCCCTIPESVMDDNASGGVTLVTNFFFKQDT